MKNYKNLLTKIQNKKILISVIGLGYIGLPLALRFANLKFKVQGLDSNLNKIQKLKKNKSYISTVNDSELRKNRKTFFPMNNFKFIKNSDVIIICVPTPITKNKSPDMFYVKDVVKKVEKFVSRNTLIILECTTYPGTCEEYFIKLFKNKNLNIGKDIFLGYSPEREDPGNKKFSILKGNLPKVVSGETPNCLNLTKKLYEKVSNKVFSVSTIKTAEFTKLLENIYRSVNIGLINELASICRKLNINIYEAIEAAKTKPFGYNPFYPGPGVGGHCIPVDPYYLTWKAKQHGLNTKFIKLAGQINDRRPKEVVSSISKYLKKNNYNYKKKILVLGLTYKKNSDDLRGSPQLMICNLFNKKLRKKLIICEPNLDKFSKKNLSKFKFIDIKKTNDKKFLSNIHSTIILTNHDIFNYKKIIKYSKFVFDSHNIVKGKSRKIISV